MQLVERTVIKQRDPRYAAIDEAAFAAKNLYNLALYEMRQVYFQQGAYLSLADVYHRVKHSDAYTALPRKVSSDVLRQLDKAWRSFRGEVKAWYEHPELFIGRPNIPRYKHKTKGRFLLTYSKQAISLKALKRGMLAPSGLGIEVPTKQPIIAIRQARIVPRSGYYIVEVIYEKPLAQADVNPSYYAGIDIGTNNLAALTSNKPGFTPIVINGRPVKSVNQYYNKRYKQLKKKLPEAERKRVTKRMERMTTRRTRRIDHYLHTASKRIIAILVEKGIGTLVIGKNDGWKQNVNMGRRNNQTFVQIPHARFIEMLTYKAELVGIRVLVTEESYTSAASFLDRDPLPAYNAKNHQKQSFDGKRIKRGLYQAADGRYINADCNGSYNIVRKVAPNAFGPEGVEDFAVHPVRITLAK